MGQALGRPFEIASRLPPLEVRRALRARKFRLLAKGPGMHGWILGSIICLYFRPSDISHGQILLGRIVPDKGGSRIAGRASIGLADTLAGWVVLGCLAYILFLSFDPPNSRDAVLRLALLQGLPLTVVALALGLWVAGSDQRYPDAPVQLIQQIVGDDRAPTAGGAPRSTENT